MTEITELPSTDHWKNPACGKQGANGTFDEAVDIFSLTHKGYTTTKGKT